jgi:hypothetical protein
MTTLTEKRDMPAFRVAWQSAQCHPEWTLDDHLEYLETESDVEVLPSINVLQAWLTDPTHPGSVHQARYTKWDYLNQDDRRALQNTPCECRCTGCEQLLVTEADFAAHFTLINPGVHLNLGECPFNPNWSGRS